MPAVTDRHSKPSRRINRGTEKEAGNFFGIQNRLNPPLHRTVALGYGGLGLHVSPAAAMGEIVRSAAEHGSDGELSWRARVRDARRARPGP